MRKLMVIMSLFLGMLVLPATSKADSITATATYGWLTMPTMFSGAGKTITFSFAAPTTLVPDTFGVAAYNVPVAVEYNGSVVSELSTLFFYTAADGGLFDLVFNVGPTSYDFSLYGGQIFDASNHFTPGSYPIATLQNPLDGSFSALYRNNSEIPTGIFSSGTVVVSSSAVPEPTSLFLLGVGLLGIVPAARKRFGAKKSAESIQ